MIADANLQVWLDAQPSTGQMLVIPYVKSAKDLRITYNMEVLQQSGSGKSRISQQGRIEAAADRATPLGRVVLGQQQGGDCRIELILRDERHELGTYRFDCPR